MSKTLGLALGSGGSRGMAHLGFLQALEEEGIKPDYITGCSMGAVIGGCYASGKTLAEIKEIALKIKPRNLVDLSFRIFKNRALLRGKKMKKLFKKHLGDTKLEDMPIPFRCVATELYSGTVHVFKEGNAAVAIQASSSIPSIFRPVNAYGMLFIDGGCLCRVPVKEVKEMGADVVVAVDALKSAGEPVGKVNNIISLVLRTFDVMDTHITNLTRRLEGDLCDVLIEPEMKGMSQYKFKDLDKAYKEGYEAGKLNAQKIKDLLQ